MLLILAAILDHWPQGRKAQQEPDLRIHIPQTTIRGNSSPKSAATRGTSILGCVEGDDYEWLEISYCCSGDCGCHIFAPVVCSAGWRQAQHSDEAGPE